MVGNVERSLQIHNVGFNTICRSAERENSSSFRKLRRKLDRTKAVIINIRANNLDMDETQERRDKGILW